MTASINSIESKSNFFKLTNLLNGIFKMTFLTDPMFLELSEKPKISTFFKFNLGLGKILYFTLLVKLKFKSKFSNIFLSKSN